MLSALAELELDLHGCLDRVEQAKIVIKVEGFSDLQPDVLDFLFWETHCKTTGPPSHPLPSMVQHFLSLNSAQRFIESSLGPP
jgi:hypothetical protein